MENKDKKWSYFKGLPGIVSLMLPVVFVMFFCGSGCKGHLQESTISEGDTLTQHARLLTLINHGNGVISAQVKNPWDTTRYLGRYLLVDRNLKDGEFEVTEGYAVIKVPVTSALVYSNVHAAPIEEMGALDAIKGVADGDYFTSQRIRKRLASKEIVDVGNSMSPSLEKIIDLSPEIVLVSPYENSGHGVLDNSGVEIVEMADYMEPTPLARAEWIKLLGVLTGKTTESTNIFAKVESEYEKRRKTNDKQVLRPRVLADLPYSGVWSQPGGKSYVAALIRDAGGKPLLDEDVSTGSVQMDIANVLELGSKADVWIIKHLTSLTKSDVVSMVPVATDFDAFKEGNIWLANTSAVPLFDDIAFHPERVLLDYMRIIHPERELKSETEYFQKIQ